jgi:hypothetical protein
MIRFINVTIALTTLTVIVLISAAVGFGHQTKAAVIAVRYGHSQEQFTFTLIDVEKYLNVSNQKLELTQEDFYSQSDFGNRMKPLNSPDGTKTVLFEKIVGNSDAYEMSIINNSDNTSFTILLPDKLRIDYNSWPVWSTESAFIYIDAGEYKPDESVYEDGEIIVTEGYYKGHLLRYDVANQTWDMVIEAEKGHAYGLAPYWLPDGKRIALMHGWDANYYLDWNLFDMEKKEFTKVCGIGVFDTPPIPSHDNKYIAFLYHGSDIELKNVVICNVETDTAQTLLKDQYPIWSIGWKY